MKPHTLIRLLKLHGDQGLDFSAPSSITKLFLETIPMFTEEELEMLYNDPQAGNWRKAHIVEEMRRREKTKVPYIDF